MYVANFKSKVKKHSRCAINRQYKQRARISGAILAALGCVHIEIYGIRYMVFATRYSVFAIRYTGTAVHTKVARAVSVLFS